MTDTLIIIADFRVAADGITAAREAFAHHVAASRADDGSERFDAVEDEKTPGRFATVEVWASRAALDRHKVTDHYRAFRAAIDPLLSAPPADRFFRRIEPTP